MEIFLGLKPNLFIAIPNLLHRQQDLKSLTKEKCRRIVNIYIVHGTLKRMHKEVAGSNRKRRTLAKRYQNAKNNILSVNFEIGSFVMIRTHARRNHKVEPIWREAMRVVSSKTDLLFIVKDIASRKQQAAYAQRMLHYSSIAFGYIALHELKKQATHYDAEYYLVKNICGACKGKGGFEMTFSWLGYKEEQKETWVPLTRVVEDMPVILENYLYFSGKQNLKRETINL